MKIIKATDYGFRKVARVVMNPDDPQWVHEDGPAPVSHTGDTTVSDTPCHDCRMNWNVIEVKWDGDGLYNVAEDGARELKTDDELTTEVLAQAPLVPVRQAIIGLEGRVL